jgi:hypothetical protein
MMKATILTFIALLLAPLVPLLAADKAPALELHPKVRPLAVPHMGPFVRLAEATPLDSPEHAGMEVIFALKKGDKSR